jgi:hypothetical protein
VAQDDFRIRIHVGEASESLLERLGVELGGEAADLARELEARRLAVSRDGDELFVYTPTRAEAVRAGELIDAVLREQSIDDARVSAPEQWLDAEDRWSDEAPGETWEEEELDHGYAPWEVRVDCGSRGAAGELADTLEAEGYRPLRRWSYLIVGTATREDAERLAERLHGRVEAGGEAVWETMPGNPFAVFGGLGGSGTPAG